MKNEDLFYAMNFLDEDLIAEADKAVTKAVVTPVKKKSSNKAKIVPLIGSFVAAAAVLCVGGIILFGLGSATSSSTDKSMGGARFEAESTTAAAAGGHVDSALGGDSYEGNISVSQGTLDANCDDTGEEMIDAPVIEAEAIDIHSENYTFEYDGATYLLVQELETESDIEDNMGESLGRIETSDFDILVDQEMFECVEYDNRVIVYVEDTMQYFVAQRLLT